MSVLLFTALLFISSTAMSKPIIVGDSIFMNGVIKESLEDHLNEKIPSAAFPGATTRFILRQFRTLIRSYPETDTVIMDGGGNDILFTSRADCGVFNDRCRANVDLIISFINKDIFEEMAEKGITRVYYLGLYYLKGGYVDLNDTVDYGMDIAIEQCETATALECVFVESREAFNLPEYYESDGLHPTPEGASILADLIIEKMR